MNFFWLEDLKLLKEDLPLTSSQPSAPNPPSQKCELRDSSPRLSPSKAQYFGACGGVGGANGQNMSPSSSSGSDFSYSPSSNFIEVTNPENGTRSATNHPFFSSSSSVGVIPGGKHHAPAINSQSNDDSPLEDPFSAFFPAEPSSVKSNSEPDASSTAPLDTSFLLDNQVLSECIRNLGYAQDGGGQSIGLPRWKDTSDSAVISKSLPSA